MRFFVDMPLSPELAQWLRAEGHDAVHASDLFMHQSPDSEILHFAADEGRVIITADLDFPRLLAALGSAGPGLILLRGGSYSEAESRDCLDRRHGVAGENRSDLPFYCRTCVTSVARAYGEMEVEDGCTT